MRTTNSSGMVEAVEGRRLMSATVHTTPGQVVITDAENVQVDEVSRGELLVTDVATGRSVTVRTDAAGGFQRVMIVAGRDASAIRLNTVHVDGVIVGSRHRDDIAVYVGGEPDGSAGSASVFVSARGGNDFVSADADVSLGTAAKGGRIHIDGGAGDDTVNVFASAVTYVSKSGGQDDIIREQILVI